MVVVVVIVVVVVVVEVVVDLALWDVSADVVSILQIYPSGQ